MVAACARQDSSSALPAHADTVTRSSPPKKLRIKSLIKKRKCCFEALGFYENKKQKNKKTTRVQTSHQSNQTELRFKQLI